MKKYYYAYVTEDMVDSFEKKLENLEEYAKVLRKVPTFSQDGEILLFYVILAEEGLIDSKWELK